MPNDEQSITVEDKIQNRRYVYDVTIQSRTPDNSSGK
jgi:hypothetical protein